jgi:hypothetical protein
MVSLKVGALLSVGGTLGLKVGTTVGRYDNASITDVGDTIGCWKHNTEVLRVGVRERC